MLLVPLLCWAVLTLHTTATCYHLQRTSLPSGPDAAEPGTPTRLEAKSYFISRDRAPEPVRQGSEGHFGYWKDPDTNCFSVLNVKSRAFLCLDSQGKLYTSVQDSDKDCRFHRIKRHKRYDVFDSCRGDVLLLRRRRAKIGARNSPKPSGYVFFRQQKNHTYRRKRSGWHTDPSDPLGFEYPHLGAMRNWRSDPEHGGNVSKETIALVDDPLEVLLSHNPPPPTLEKHWGNRKMRF
ncbi:uncharacterized protein Hap1MRO34_012420 [Clarias gariepinus]|uniref:uncharacterized protein LOC128532124 n=1 Tax=Clarias gariepinus TaxID=13013 RepID=UPI00234D9783|nr:uncharacterized protein LOC128532124 [Clarias gariepinus]